MSPRLRRLWRVLAPAAVTTALLGLGMATPASAAAADGDPAPAALPFSSCSTAAFHDDSRLGPARLPLPGVSEVGDELLGYRRGGSGTVPQLLARYWDASTAWWTYPPDNGYRLDAHGQPEERVTTLHAGSLIDRYGSEYGGFLSPLGTPYAERALPPSNLDTAEAAYTCGYHAYQVVKSFRVDAGPIAAWFDQPGGGEQYQLDTALQPDATSVGQLVADGYLRRLPVH